MKTELSKGLAPFIAFLMACCALSYASYRINGPADGEGPYARFRAVPADCKAFHEEGKAAVARGLDRHMVIDHVYSHCPAGAVVPLAKPWPTEHQRP